MTGTLWTGCGRPRRARVVFPKTPGTLPSKLPKPNWKEILPVLAVPTPTLWGNFWRFRRFCQYPPRSFWNFKTPPGGLRKAREMF